MESSLELVKSGDSQVTIKLSGVLNFDSVASLAQDTEHLFADYNNIIIDLSGITYVNSAGLALLLNWKQLAEASNKTLQISGTPEKLLNIARISELESVLY